MSAVIRMVKWARPILARISFRREFGREPTDDEVDVRMKKFNDGTLPLPLLGAITAAFMSGEEVRPFASWSYSRSRATNWFALQKVHPWKLECEDYEEDLQREIAIAYPYHEKKAIKPKN